MNNTTITTVRDLLDKKYELITNSYTIEAILETINREKYKDYYGCLFLELIDSEINELYGCTQSIPHLSYDVDKLV